jgi:hypothetical protein
MDSPIMATKAVILHYGSNDFSDVYQNASRILDEEYNIRSVCALDNKSLVSQVKNFQKKYQKVLLVSHDLLPFDTLKECLFENVYYFGGQTLSKRHQIQTLRSYKINVPEDIAFPSDIKDVFSKLGNHVIAGPDTYAASSNQLINFLVYDPVKNKIKYKRAGDDDNSVMFGKFHEMYSYEFTNWNRYYYTKYVGSSGPIYWRAKIESIFGEYIMGYVMESHENAPSAPFIRLNESIITEPTETMISLGKKISSIMATEHQCGFISVDMVLDCPPTLATESNIFVVETNLMLVGLYYNPFKVNRSNGIALGCYNFLENHMNCPV